MTIAKQTIAIKMLSTIVISLSFFLLFQYHFS